tara:strand:+ start:83 stop:922 length:840 start_codon:yes stop_codon:yes gene_type:complete
MIFKKGISKIIPDYIKFILRPIYRIIFNTINSLWDSRLKKYIDIKESNKIIFKVLDYGKLTRWRASSFESVEPETLEWISKFNKEDKLLDIGANIGLYSLYAAFKGINVISVEPDALNYALLNLNIRLNKFGNKITPYCIAIHNKTKLSKFNISSDEWGGALNSFDNNLDFKGDEYKPIHTQVVFGTSLDSLENSLPFIPNHLKVDVDGNEYLILLGARGFLQKKSLKSILIELDETRKDYLSSINLIKDSGFKLVKKINSCIDNNDPFFHVKNHIFIR